MAVRLRFKKSKFQIAASLLLTCHTVGQMAIAKTQGVKLSGMCFAGNVIH
jgi:hypothetical protein